MISQLAMGVTSQGTYSSNLLCSQGIFLLCDFIMGKSESIMVTTERGRTETGPCLSQLFHEGNDLRIPDANAFLRGTLVDDIDLAT